MLTLRVLQTYLLLTLSSVVAAAPLESGDPRAGYEGADFVTRSAALEHRAGQALDLAALPVPLGLPPRAATLDPRAVALGRQLFFDRRLSVNATLSCGMCHIPEQGFAQNELATPVGVLGRSVRRNAPSLYNVSYLPRLFLDGREPSLEAQIWSPLLAHNEMANPDRSALLDRLNDIPNYVEQFAVIYPEGLTEQTLGHALASYQRGLLSAGSPFDRWYFGGDEGALSDQAKAGFRIFREQGCAACHVIGREAALFTDHGYYNTGIAYRSATSGTPRSLQIAPGVEVQLSVAVTVPVEADDGLAETTGKSGDRWRYRVPSLRNVALTAPYMHDGSLRTLEAVIAYYEQGGSEDPDLDAWIVPLTLTEADRTALREFLQTLTGDNVVALAADARSVVIGDHSN